MKDLSNKSAIVVGASRGLGQGIANALGEAGAEVVAVSRTQATNPEAHNSPANIHDEIADAPDPTVAARFLDRYEADIVVLVAGATPHMRPLRQQTWETFSIHWHNDVRVAFNWVREALLKPMRPGSRVVVSAAERS